MGNTRGSDRDIGEGHKTFNKPAGTPIYGNRKGNGEVLEGRLKIGFCNLSFSDSGVAVKELAYSDSGVAITRLAYFPDITGLPFVIGFPESSSDKLNTEKVPRVRTCEGKTEVQSPKMEWIPFSVYVGTQIGYCLERGEGVLSWPSYQNITPWSKFIELPEKSIEKTLTEMGYSWDRAEGFVQELKKYKESHRKKK